MDGKPSFDKSEIDYNWLIPYLERINKRTPIRIEECIRKLNEGIMQAFTAGPHSVIIGMMDKDGTVWLYGAAGKLEDLLKALPIFELWYYYRGGERVVIPGRSGWKRILPRYGYRVQSEQLEKDLV